MVKSVEARMKSSKEPVRPHVVLGLNISPPPPPRLLRRARPWCLCGPSDTVASPTAVLVVSLGMVNTKPFVAAACLAEVVIIEPDNVASIIRIADTFFIDVPPDLPADLKPAIVLNAFISLKSGDVKGSFDVEL